MVKILELNLRSRQSRDLDLHGYYCCLDPLVSIDFFTVFIFKLYYRVVNQCMAQQ